MNYKNGFTDETIESHVIEIEDDEQDMTVNGHGKYQSYSCDMDEKSEEDAEVRLKKLQSLYNQSLITYEECEQKKKDILDEL